MQGGSGGSGGSNSGGMQQQRVGLQQRRRQPAEDCGSDGGNELVRYTNELVLSLGDKKEDVAPNPL